MGAFVKETRGIGKEKEMRGPASEKLGFCSPGSVEKSYRSDGGVYEVLGMSSEYETGDGLVVVAVVVVSVVTGGGGSTALGEM